MINTQMLESVWAPRVLSVVRVVSALIAFATLSVEVETAR